MAKKQVQLWKPDSLYYCGMALLGAAFFLWAVLALTGINPEDILLPCLFHKATGLYCPGCGGTRAFFALLHGNIRESLHYHPLVLYGTVLYVWYMVSNTIQYAGKGHPNVGMRYRPGYVWTGIAILAMNTIWKNALFLLYGQTL